MKMTTKTRSNRSKKTVATTEIEMATTATVAPTVGAEISPEALEELIASHDEATAELPEIAVEDESDDIEALLSDLTDEPVEAPAAEPTLEVAEEALEEVVSALENEEARKAAYEEQESASTIVSEDDSGTPATSAASEGTKEKKERTPRMTLDALPAESFVLTVEDAERDLTEVKAEVLAAKPTAIKVAEKFENVLLSLAAGKKPSIYTVTAMKALRAGEIDSKALKEAMLAVGKESTARAQSSQMMLLLPALKIAKREGNKLVLNADSVLAQAMFGMFDAEGAAA